MEVLREHRDSVMAVLEAFVYDPLLNWRLMDSKSQIMNRAGQSDSACSEKVSVKENTNMLESRVVRTA